MQIILRTNDPVLLSFVQSLFREAGIGHHVADTHMSLLEGSIGAFPRRVLVADDEVAEARRLLGDAGLAAELVPLRATAMTDPQPDASDPLAGLLPGGSR